MDGKTEEYYRVLNLGPSATPEEITQAYQDLIRVWDPERFTNSPRLEMMAEEKLKELIEAYRALTASGNAEPAAPAAAPESMPSGSTVPGSPESQASPDPFASPRPFFTPGWAETPAEPPSIPAALSVLLPERPKPAGRAPEERLERGPASFLRMPAGSQPEVGIRSFPSPASGTVAAAPKPAGPEVPKAPAPSPVSAWERLIAKKEVHYVAAGAAAFAFLAGAMLLYDDFTKAPAKPKAPPPGLYSAEVSKALPAEAPPPAPKISRRAAPEREAVHAPMPTGTELMEPAGRAGAGKLRISNRSGQDAVARLASQAAPESPLRLVYVQPGTDVTIGSIGLGVYLVSFSLGPVPASGRPRSFGAPHGPFQFLQIESVNGTQSDEYQIVLKPQN